MADELKALGNAHFSNQEFSEAVEKYSEAIKLDAASPLLYSNRSAAFLGAGDANAALADADKALELDANFAKGYLRRCKALRALGRPVHAEMALKDCLKTLGDSDPILTEAMRQFLLEEDGVQTPLRGVLPGTPAQNMRDFQSAQGLGMHTEAFIRRLPAKSLQCAFLGDLAGFRASWDPVAHANLRSWDVKLPITSLIVSGAQRKGYVQPSLRPAGGFQHAACMREVLDNKWCRVDAKDIAGYTALSHAAGHHPCLDLAKMLLEAGADPSTRNRMGSTPLFSAIMAFEKESCRMLIEADTDLQAVDFEGAEIQNMARVIPEVLALMQAKMGLHQENKDAQAGSACNNPHCRKEGATQRCSGCRVTLYCNRDCQRAHWKIHKKVCAAMKDGASAAAPPAAGADLPGVLRCAVHSHNGLHSMVVPMSVVSESVARATGMRSEGMMTAEEMAQRSFRSTEAGAKYVSDKNMVVKVQVCLNPLPGMNEMMVYNKSRKFQCMIKANSGNGKKLDAMIRKKGILGQKGYFLAYSDKQGELCVLVDKMLPAQPW